MRQRTERLEKIHLVICTIAAFVMTAGFVVRALLSPPTGFPTLFSMAMWVSLSIIVFYVVGIFVKAFLVNNVFAMPESSDLEEIEASANTELIDEAPPIQDDVYDDTIYDDAMLESAVFSE